MTRRSYSILALDDNPGDIHLLREALSGCGYPCELTVAYSQQEAGALLATQRFDLFISDFGTDYAAATTFLRSVRARAARMPIIVLSGIPDPNPAYEAGANAFVSKPRNVNELFDKIRELIRFWTSVAVLPSDA